MVRIAIVGWSGGRVVPSLQTRELFDAMVAKARSVIESMALWETVHLVSGGAAWSDHVAVGLFLQGQAAGLTLHLPCTMADKFQDNGDTRWEKNPGRLANARHRMFSSSTGIASLREILEAERRGAILRSGYDGFHSRNTAVANDCDVLIAFSWAKEDGPNEGGTMDTWKKAGRARVKRVHVSLASLSSVRPVQ